MLNLLKSINFQNQEFQQIPDRIDTQKERERERKEKKEKKKWVSNITFNKATLRVTKGKGGVSILHGK